MSLKVIECYNTLSVRKGIKFYLSMTGIIGRMYFVHSRLQDESLQVTISKLL